jgi:hypothetical protein
MALKSLYCVECVCGHYIESETNTLICPGCQRLVLIDWQDREPVDDRERNAAAPTANSTRNQNSLKL